MGKLGDQTAVSQSDLSVAWIPYDSGLSDNRLFELSSARDNALERFVEAKKVCMSGGVAIDTIDLCDLSATDIVVFYAFTFELKWLIRAVAQNPKVKLINIPHEPAVVSPLHDEKILEAMPFDRILVWNDRLAGKGGPFVKFNYGEPVIHETQIPMVPFSSRRLLAAIYSNKLSKHRSSLYSERARAFEFFARKTDDFDLFGVGWESSDLASIVSSYRGKVDNKKAILKNYKFAICFENTRDYPGYITEKIFDCFAAGVVPIYLGAPNIEEYIPKECYIDFRDFRDYEHLYTFMLGIDEGSHRTYLDAVKKFVLTPEYYQFTSKRYAELVLEQMRAVQHSQAGTRSVFRFRLSILKVIASHPFYFINNFKRCRRFMWDLLATF